MAKPGDDLTLFGPAADIRPAPPEPASGRVVRELKLLGVPEKTARGYGRKQAYAVLARLRKQADQLARAGKSPAPPPAEPEPPPARTGIRWPLPAVEESAAFLGQLLERGEPNSIARVISAEVFGLEPPEVRELGECLAGIHARRRSVALAEAEPVRRAAEPDADRPAGDAPEGGEPGSPGGGESPEAPPGGGAGGVIDW